MIGAVTITHPVLRAVTVIDPRSELLPSEPEYWGIPKWEQRSLYREFLIHRAEGLAAHPDRPKVVRDRAAYLSWRASSRIWGSLAFGLGVLIGAIRIFVGPTDGPASVALLLVGYSIVLGCMGMVYLRAFQASRRHPARKRYRRSVRLTDWTDYGDLE